MNTNETVDTIKLEDSNDTDTAMINFTIPTVDKLAGVDETTALQSTLAKQAEMFAEKATKLMKDVKASIKPFFSSGQTPGILAIYGAQAGKPSDMSEEDYCKKVVTIKDASGVKVTAPVAVAFGDTAEAMVAHLCEGGIPLSKFEEFKFNNSMVAKSVGHGNAVKGQGDAENKPVVNEFGEFRALVKLYAMDAAGNLVGFYQILALAAKAVYTAQNEHKALELLDGMSKKTGLDIDVVQTLVQAIINATTAKHFKSEAKRYAELAKTTSQQREAKAKLQAEASGKPVSTLVATQHTGN